MNLLRLPEIKTNRLHLRKLRETDWEAISYLRSDQEVNKFVKRSTAESKEEALEFIRKISTAVDNGETYYWAISVRDTDQMIGSICLWKFSEDRKYAEVGYDLGTKFQGLGIMNESLNAVLNFGFKFLSLNTIEAYTHKNNEASKKLLLKNGFKLVLDMVDSNNTDNLIYKISR